MTYLTEREIHVIGIQRTGQHAITSWIIGHFDKVCYKNSMKQLGMRTGHGVQPPFWHFSLKKEGWKVKDFVGIDNDAVILGTEFKVYDIGLNPKLDKHKRKICAEYGRDSFSKKQDYVLVLRNPYNHYASVLKWGRNKQLSPVKSFSTMWKKMARECLGETSNLPSPKTVILYDEWFSSEDYRKETSKKLDLAHTDRRLNVVMKIGIGRSWGSSFDKMEKKQNAQSMDVLNRWKEVEDDRRFKELIQDDELKELAQEFNW